MELDPLSVIAHVALGIRAYYAGQLDLAIASYEKALELNPGDPSAHYLLSLVDLAQGKPQQALAEVERQRGAQAVTWERHWLIPRWDASRSPMPRYEHW